MTAHPDTNTRTIRRIGIIGAGAMGTSLASILSNGAEVVMVIRDRERASQVSIHGVVLRGLARAASRPHIVSSIADLRASGSFDAVFVACKTTAIDSVCAELAPILQHIGGRAGPPFVISFQNGIEPGRRLMAQLGHARVLRMVLNYGARMSPDGGVELLCTHPPHAVGSLDPALHSMCVTLAALLTRCGIDTVAVDDIEPLVWFKGIMNAAMNPVAALTDNSVGEVLDSPARQLVERLIDEGLRVAAAEGIDLGADARERMWVALEAARSHTPSMVEDIRKGRPSEVGQLNMQIVEHAARIGIEARDHELISMLIDAFDWRVFQQSGLGRITQRVPSRSGSC